jgi:hypothetical protein
MRVRLPITHANEVQCTVYDKTRKLTNVSADQMVKIVSRNCWCSATIVGTLWGNSCMCGVVWYVKELIVYPDQESIPSVWEPTVSYSVEKCLVINADEDIPKVPMDDDNEEEIKEEDELPPKKHVSLTDVTPFDLQCNGPNTLFVAPSKYLIGEATTVSQYDMYSRFCREVNGCFDGFNWDHVCVAGGLLTGLIDKKYDPAVYAESDIDVFIYGSTVEEAKSHSMRVFKFLQTKFNDLWVVPYKCESIIVVNLCTGKMNRSIQLICITGITTPRQLIDKFDLSHCQIAFDGKEFICTPQCMETMRSRQTQLVGNRTSEYRLYKAYMRGFSVIIPNHPVNVKTCDETGFSYGFAESTPIVDNLRHYTLDKLLTEDTIMVFSKMSFNPRNKEQYIKNGTAIQYCGINDWVNDYIKSHTPNAY